MGGRYPLKNVLFCCVLQAVMQRVIEGFSDGWAVKKNANVKRKPCYTRRHLQQGRIEFVDTTT